MSSAKRRLFRLGLSVLSEVNWTYDTFLLIKAKQNKNKGKQRNACFQAK